MAETEKKIIFQITTKADDAIKKIVQYEAKVEELKRAERALNAEIRKQGEATAEQKARLVALKNEQRAYQKEISNQNRIVQNTLTAESELYANTLQALRSQLSVEKDKLRYMEQGSQEYQRQIELVKQVNDQVKEAEESYGVYVRNVGNYSSALNGLAGTVRNFSKAGMLAFALMGETSEESEEAQKKMASLQKAMMALILVQNISTKATKNQTIAQVADNIAKGVGINTASRLAKAEASAAALKKADTVATKGVTAATWLWNAALAANPVFLLITAIAAVVAGIALLSKALGGQAREQKALNAEIERYNTLIKEQEVREQAQQLEAARRKAQITKAYADEIEQMKRSGATAEQVAKKKTEMEKALQVVSDQRLAEEIANTRKTIALKAEELRMQELLLTKMREGSKRYKEQKEKVAELAGALNTLNQELAGKETEQSNNRIAQIEKEFKSVTSSGKSAYDKQKEHLENLHKIERAHFEQKKKYLYDYTKSAEENAKAETEWNRQAGLMSLEQEQRQKKALLELDKKYNKITQEQYKSELEVLKSEYDTFVKEMEDAVVREQVTLLESAIKMAGGEMLDKQLEQLEQRYHDAAQAILKDSTLTQEEKRYYVMRLEEKEREEVKALHERADKEIREKTEQALGELYKNDYRLFSNNSIEKTRAEIEQLEVRIKAMKEAGQSTYKEEADLKSKQIQLIGLESSKRLIEADKDRKRQYEIRKQALEDEQALYQRGSLEWAEIEKEKTELLKDELNARTEALSEFGSMAMDIYGQFADMMDAFSSRSLERYKADNEAKTASLDKQLKAGLISQKQYDKQKEKMDKELSEKELKIKRRQAVQEKAMNIAQTVMNTATGLMKTFANLGYPLAIPFMALGAAMGAMQLATIIAEPLPKAREGLIVGQSHEQGGVIINAEGGERIVAREPARAFPELLNLISYIGKNAGVPDTGYAGRMIEGGVEGQVLADAIGNVVADRMRDLQVVVSVDDIDDAQAVKTRVENNARL